MARIDFPGRKIVVMQVQRALGGLVVDGDDRRSTWQAIAHRLLFPVPSIHASSAVQFPDRDAITRRVQVSLGGVLIDGHDGQETWAALAQRLDPKLEQISGPPPPAQMTVCYQTSAVGRAVKAPVIAYTEREVYSPNRNAGTNERKGCIIHHASGYYDGTVSWCMQKGTHAGYHVLINTDGRRTSMGADTARLHHAGKSVWKGRSGCNAFMLGLAFIGNTNDGAMRGQVGPNLTAHEVASALEWLRPRMQKYGWTKDDITAHRIVSPGRKDDTSLSALQQILSAL